MSVKIEYASGAALLPLPGYFWRGGGAEHAIYGKKPGFFDPDQLYDLRNDPDEENNLASHLDYQPKLQEMRAELRKYTRSLPGKFD